MYGFCLMITGLCDRAVKGASQYVFIYDPEIHANPTRLLAEVYEVSGYWHTVMLG